MEKKYHGSAHLKSNYSKPVFLMIGFQKVRFFRGYSSAKAMFLNICKLDLSQVK